MKFIWLNANMWSFNSQIVQCEKNVGEALQYVQPVQVIPVGSPVPALAIGNQPYIPTQTVYTNNNNRASYDAPSSSYSAPKPSYSPPRPVYNSKTSYNPPKATYGAPSAGYSAPSSSYGAPSSFNSPTSNFNAPSSSYGAPTSSYGAPSSSYGAPSSSYGAPSTTYGVPSYLSSASSSSSSYLSSKQSGLSSYQTGFNDDYSETLRPTREGRLEECYCVPVAQCPASQVIANFGQLVGSLGQATPGNSGQVSVVTGQVVGTPVKDYSALINPRVKNSELNITAAEELADATENKTQTQAGSRYVYMVKL